MEKLADGGGGSARHDTAMIAIAAMPHKEHNDCVVSGFITGKSYHMLFRSMHEKCLRCKVVEAGGPSLKACRRFWQRCIALPREGVELETSVRRYFRTTALQQSQECRGQPGRLPPLEDHHSWTMPICPISGTPAMQSASTAQLDGAPCLHRPERCEYGTEPITEGHGVSRQGHYPACIRPNDL